MRNSLYPDDWLEVAEKDWNRSERMLEDGDIEAAGYFLQQSLEKYLKAFLLAKGWTLRRIHELDALLDDAVKFQPSLESFRILCEQVSGYYPILRYPKLIPVDLTAEDLKKDIEGAQEFIQALGGKNK